MHHQHTSANIVGAKQSGWALERRLGNLNWWSERFRRRRTKLFFELTAPLPRPVSVLDVGGTVSFWAPHLDGQGLELTLLNIFQQESIPGIRVVVGDACDLTQFEDRSFDLVFSNSVLGHVGGWPQQKRMASEIQRVGRRYFVQTPNQGFPIDWRTLMPFFHWLSPASQAWWLRRFRVGRYGRVANQEEAMHLASRIRNLNQREISELFPKGKIVSEKVLGFTKSFIVHHGF